MNDAYNFVLDIYPVAQDIAADNALISGMLLELGLALLFDESSVLAIECTEKLRLLLQLCYDLGLIDDAVHRYLCRSLRSIAESIR